MTGPGDPQQRDGTLQNEARRQAGTSTTREGIDKTIDHSQDTSIGRSISTTSQDETGT